MKGKALRKHSLHEKTTASVLLKLKRISGTLFSIVNNIHSKIPEDQKRITTHSPVIALMCQFMFVTLHLQTKISMMVAET